MFFLTGFIRTFIYKIPPLDMGEGISLPRLPVLFQFPVLIDKIRENEKVLYLWNSKIGQW